MRSRPFLTRLGIAAFGMLLLCAAVVVGLGWAVRERPYWFERIIGGERCEELFFAYARALGRCWQADKDGDGFPDGVERYLQTGSNDPLDQPTTCFLLDGRSTEVEGRPHFLLQPGERRRVQIHLGFHGTSGVFAPGMQILLSPNSPSLLCLPGGTPAADDFLVPVASDGAMEFDLMIPANAETSEPWEGTWITGALPRINRIAGHFAFVVARRQPEIPFTEEELSAAEGWSPRSLKGKRLVRLTWQPKSLWGRFVIEATRDASGDPPGADWFVVGVRLAADNRFTVAYPLEGNPGHRGRWKFRVVPIEPIRPREQ